MGRKQQLVAVIVVLVAVATAVAVAAASRGGDPKPAAPTSTTLAHMSGVGDDDANVMRRLQREKLKKSHK